ARRDGAAVQAALEDLRKAAEAGDNVLPATITAVKAYATIGEIVAVLREVYGSWQPTAVF
ncbi:MAG TPA: methylmalonyl-CoA mutase family protein, partial [Actinomycetales bacterium]|nr:methylmalonyl-CoA mutase family protein [Actinomycetales bacterium]